MHYRTLGQTGLQVSEVGLGAMPFGGMVTQPDGTQFGWSGTEDRELISNSRFVLKILYDLCRQALAERIACPRSRV
jgi:hypothetical protein